MEEESPASASSQSRGDDEGPYGYTRALRRRTYSSGVERGAEARGNRRCASSTSPRPVLSTTSGSLSSTSFATYSSGAEGGGAGVNRRQIEVKRGGERNYGDDISRRFEVSDTSIGRSATRAACKSHSSAPSAFCSTRFSSDGVCFVVRRVSTDRKSVV